MDLYKIHGWVIIGVLLDMDMDFRPDLSHIEPILYPIKFSCDTNSTFKTSVLSKTRILRAKCYI